jgi:uncharacterized protein (DUF2345 family)
LSANGHIDSSAKYFMRLAAGGAPVAVKRGIVKLLTASLSKP